MVLAPPPYRSDYERQCFPALPYSTCVNASTIDATDVSTLRTYLLSSGHIINAQRTSDRDIIGFFDESAIRAAARRYFTPRELISRILDSRILQSGLLKRLHEDDDLRDAIDALDPATLRDRERFRLLYAADSFPAGLTDELDPVQISAAFIGFHGCLRADVDALRARTGQPAVRNFVLTRVRQKRADAATIYGDNVMREFVTTLDPSRLTHEELSAILSCVSGRATTPTSGEREFRNLQAALRRESEKAQEVIQRRYEPQSGDECILRIALEMLGVRFIGGDGDVRCQLVRALSEMYDGCDELLSPGPVGDMTPLCRQVNLFAVHGKQVMKLDEEQQKRAFARLREDLRVDLAQEPEWLGETRVRRMLELWDAGLDPAEKELTDPQALREMVRRGNREDVGAAGSPTSFNSGGRLEYENYTDTDGGKGGDEMEDLEVEVEYLSPKSNGGSPASSPVAAVSPNIEWDEEDDLESEVEKDVCEEVHQPEWQQIQCSGGEDENEEKDEEEHEGEDADADEDEDEYQEEDEDEAPLGVNSPGSPSLMPVVSNVQQQQVRQEYKVPPKATPDKLDNRRNVSASPRTEQHSPRLAQHTEPELTDADETQDASHSDEEDQSENQSEGLSDAETCQSDTESQLDDPPHPKEPARAVSLAGKAESRKRRHNDSSSRTPQPSSDTRNQDTVSCRRDLAIETNIVQGNASYWRQKEREVEHGAITDQVPWPRPKKHHKRPTTERGGARRAEGQGRDHGRRTHHRR